MPESPPPRALTAKKGLTPLDVTDALMEAKGNVRAAAKSLGVTWQTLYARMETSEVQTLVEQRLRSHTTALAIEAITVLGGLMKRGKTESTRRQAAEAVLDRSVPRTQARRQSSGTAVALSIRLTGQGSTPQVLDSATVSAIEVDSTDTPSALESGHEDRP